MMAQAWWLCVLLSPILSAHGLDFHSDFQTEGSDNGTAHFKLHSSGQLLDILYLDSSADFDVWIGWDGQLRVHSLTSDNGNETWWPGRLLLGGKVRQLSTNGSVTQVSLLAKVKAVQQLEEGMLKIELQRERDVDLLQSGIIHMEFSPPDVPEHTEHVPSGHLPDLPPGSEVEALQISVHQDAVAMESSADKAEDVLVVGPPAASVQPNDSADLMIKLTDTHVIHKPHHSVTIKAGNGKNSTQSCYTTVSTVQVTISGSLEARARSEIGVEKRHLVSSSPSRPLHRLPLALPPSGPTLLFGTSFSSATWLDVYVTTSGPFHFRGSYNASGNIITESTLCAGEPPMSTSKLTGWTADVSPWWGRSSAHFKAKLTFFHEVRYAHSLYFEGVKEPVKSLPSIALSVRPIVRVKSSQFRDKTCLQADLSLHGRLALEETELQSDSVDDPEPKSGQAVDEVAWEGRLLHQCNASCDLSMPVPPPVSMATACGQPSTRVSRGDPSFNRLEVVLANEVDFLGEEAQSAWCGALGQPCPPCQSQSPEAPPCADRVMAPDAARSLSRLAHLVQLEFPQRRVVVEEAWDEPDESHPQGRHGNQSLHYEGKALLLTLSSLTQESELRRLAQLALCAGFSYADVASSSVAVCTAEIRSDEHTRHKRSAASSECSEDDNEFQKKMQEIGDGTLHSTVCYISLADGESFPPEKTVAEVIGPPLDPEATEEKLYLYTFPDVEFQYDSCVTCRQPLMTHRMALRLRRLAALVRSKAAEVETKRVQQGFGSTEKWLDDIRQSAKANALYDFENDRRPDSETWLFGDHIKGDHRVKRTAINHRNPSLDSDLWPNCTVYYQFHRMVDDEGKKKIKDGIKVFEKYTCLKFVEDSQADHRIIFEYKANEVEECYSTHAGRRKAGVQEIRLFGEFCTEHGTILHEIGHAIGWEHEHQRPDRDAYITVKEEAMKGKYGPQFQKMESSDINNYGVPYDYLSIMHYPHHGVMKTNDATFQELIGQTIGLSFMDIKLANLMYNCRETCSLATRTSCNGTNMFLDKNCNCWCASLAYPYDLAHPIRTCAAIQVKYEERCYADASPPQEQKEYFRRGQALTLRLSPDWPLDVEQLTQLAIEAGFDFIVRTGEYIKVFVKLQEGHFAKPVYFSSQDLLVAPTGFMAYDIYNLSNPAFGLLSYSLLDGHDSSLPLSPHYKVGDFAHPDYRFFRMNPLLVTCLDQTADALGWTPPVERGWGYRPVPENIINLASRHLQERDAFVLGTAVYLKPSPREDLQRVLLNISSSLMKICVPISNQVNQKLGIGLHKDKVYLDLRSKTSGDKKQDSVVDFWDVGNPDLYDRFSAVKLYMDKGCLEINPVSGARVCSKSFLLDDLNYFSFDINPLSAPTSTSKFCKDTLQFRTDAAMMMSTSLVTALGQRLPMSTVNTVVNDCLIDHCGGSVGIGDNWKEKVRGCAELVKLFSKHASAPWGETRDRGAIVNADHPDSSLHSLACHNGSRCVENTQLYSLALTALHARYRPDPSLSQEELLFSGEDNPSPLLEAIHQEMAHSMQGKAKVYIERPEDLSALKDTLKVLMVHNKKVTDVEFHYPDQKLRDDVQEKLRRHLDSWAANSCPIVSRQATAPYSSHVISPSRRKRSAERSRERNEARRALLNWEEEWLMKI